MSSIQQNGSALVQANLLNKLSHIGRYSYKDFEKFGNLSPYDSLNLARQDGWVALTEEVPNINQLSYGTGVLYIHGEMELPKSVTGEGKVIVGSNFSAVGKDETQHFILPWTQAKEFTPAADIAAGDEDSASVGYDWTFEDVGVDAGGSNGTGSGWYYNDILKHVGSIFPSTTTDDEGNKSFANLTVPTGSNDNALYMVSNERNNFPWIIINSGAPASVVNLLNNMQGRTGMTGNMQLPTAATSPENIPDESLDPTFPPALNGGISYEGDGIQNIINFISPITFVPIQSGAF
jgi:hypothetical protein|tara:strand:+ start:8859 stop:9734 length:876 start_codon:yes stop_codon:yes gene_type:complete